MSEDYSDRQMEKILKRVHKWGFEFSQSPHFAGLSEEQKGESEAILMHFAEYMYSYVGLAPEEWDEEGLEECCLEVLPRKISAEAVYFRSVGPVLEAFFRCAAEKGWLKSAPQLARRVEKIGRRIVQNAADPGNWGLAKSFLMAAMDAGVDPTNQQEMDAFMYLYNLQLMAQHERRKGGKRSAPPLPEPSAASGLLEDERGTMHRAVPKVGRNDPCPCGSGKKYKKCCGKSEPR
jgi:hypothetical protein